MFVVMKLQDFELESVMFPSLPVKVETGKMIGFLPVYATREDALVDFPDAELLEIEEVSK